MFDYISLSQRLFLFNIGNHFQGFIADSDLDVFNWAGSVRSYLFCIQVEQFIQSLPDTFLLDFAALGQKLCNKQLIPDSWHFLHVTSHWGTKVEVEVSREKHVFDDGLCGHFPQESDEEELFYHRGGDSAEWGKSEEELPKPGGLVGVLGPAVLLQGALRLLLQLLDHWGWRQSDGVWNSGGLKSSFDDECSDKVKCNL